MRTEVHVDDQFLTVGEIADRLKVKHDTVRRLFIHEPGVVIIRFPRKGKRVYRTLRIPVPVYERVVTRLMYVE